MKRIVFLSVMLLVFLSGCRKAMSPEQLMREAAANLANSDRLLLRMELTLDPEDGTEAEAGNLAVANLAAVGLRSDRGRIGGDVRLSAGGEVMEAQFYTDGEWLYVDIGEEGVRLPLGDTGMEGLLSGEGSSMPSELMPEPEVRVEEDRTVLLYHMDDSELNSVFREFTGTGAEFLLPNGLPTLDDGEMQIIISEGEIRQIAFSVLTVGTEPVEFQLLMDFLDTAEMHEPEPPEGYLTFPELNLNETAGAGS